MSISTQEALPGQSLDLGNGARLEVLYAGGRGATLLLSWKNFRMLLLASGHAALNPPAWAENMQRLVVLVSVSALETLRAWEGYALLRTDRIGWTELTTD